MGREDDALWKQSPVKAQGGPTRGLLVGDYAASAISNKPNWKPNSSS